MNPLKILSYIFAAICFLTAVRGHYIIAGVLFVITVLIAQWSASFSKIKAAKEEDEPEEEVES